MWRYREYYLKRSCALRSRPMRVTAVLEVVKKTTGGRQWVKPWGLTLSKTQKQTRAKNNKEAADVAAILKQAAAAEPKPAAAKAAQASDQAQR